MLARLRMEVADTPSGVRVPLAVIGLATLVPLDLALLFFFDRLNVWYAWITFARHETQYWWLAVLAIAWAAAIEFLIVRAARRVLIKAEGRLGLARALEISIQTLYFSILFAVVDIAAVVLVIFAVPQRIWS
ncbi:MAG TPA: hypothetical protein VGS21_07175 [Acidimicrobiales bacterium]|nr:hypothetical protein [Acidimicrobiales bacterium]